MNLFHLRYFVKLAHTKHYTRAAEELCITQPSLSHAITQLENELGLPLFERSGRNTELTRFGREFLETAERALSTLDSGVGCAQARGAWRGPHTPGLPAHSGRGVRAETRARLPRAEPGPRHTLHLCDGYGPHR